MTIQLAVLCDAATDYNGKLNILGTFDTIFAQQFPAAHPQCSVALRVSYTKMEEGNHTLKINFESSGINLDFLNFVFVNQGASVSLTSPTEGYLALVLWRHRGYSALPR